MKFKLLTIGRTKSTYLKEGITDYIKRLEHYVNFELIELADVKDKTPKMAVETEGRLFLKSINEKGNIWLLDESGKQFDSVSFSIQVQKTMNAGNKCDYFLIGGAYGFSDEIKQLAKGKIALSKMTFTHEMVRLFFVEQLYRSMTILRGEKYHH